MFICFGVEKNVRNGVKMCIMKHVVVSQCTVTTDAAIETVLDLVEKNRQFII